MKLTNKIKNKSKQLRIYICPNCTSPNVHRIFMLKNLFGTIPKWHCKKCNFESMIFPLAIIEKSKLNKNDKAGGNS